VVDENGRKRADVSELTPQQLLGVDLLCSGRTITDTAAELDLRRKTVSDWLHHNPAFQAALNARRQDIWQSTADRLRGLLPRALDTLEAALDGDQSLVAAVHILKASGVYKGLQPPQGPTEPEDAEIDERRRQFDRTLRDLASRP
jgi:hypothetical protein